MGSCESIWQQRLCWEQHRPLGQVDYTGRLHRTMGTRKRQQQCRSKCCFRALGFHGALGKGRSAGVYRPLGPDGIMGSEHHRCLNRIVGAFEHGWFHRPLGFLHLGWYDCTLGSFHVCNAVVASSSDKVGRLSCLVAAVPPLPLPGPFRSSLQKSCLSPVPLSFSGG